MAKEDPRRIPQVAGNTEGTVTVQGVNDVIRQVVEMVYQLEGRRGSIKLRDDISLEAPERYTPISLRGNQTPGIALSMGGANNDCLTMCRGAVKNDLGSWIATDATAVLAEIPADGTILIYVNSGLSPGQIFNPTLVSTLSQPVTPTPTTSIPLVGAKIYNSVAQTFAQGGATDSYFVTYGAAAIDTDGFFNLASPTKLTVPTGKGGYYLIGGGHSCTTSGAMTYAAPGIKKNGTTYVSYSAYPVIGTSLLITGLPTVLVNMPEGAYVEMGIKTDGVGTATLQTGVQYGLWMYRVGT